MQVDKELFAPVMFYVREVARILRLNRVEIDRSSLAACVQKIRAFYSEYPSASSTPGVFYIPPAEIENTRAIAEDVCSLAEKIATLSDEDFAKHFRPHVSQEHDATAKARPKDVAQVCRNGHLVLGSLQRFPQFRKSFCEDCGARTIDACPSCEWPIAGIGENAWMSGTGRYQPPKYCGECGNSFPWTETALAAATEFTDDLEMLNAEEKAALKATLEDLTIDSARTPLAASRFKRFMGKIGPVAGAVLQKIVETIATEAAKKSMGL